MNLSTNTANHFDRLRRRKRLLDHFEEGFDLHVPIRYMSLVQQQVQQDGTDACFKEGSETRINLLGEPSDVG